MTRILRRRPSPATVIACISLFVALGGVSYGVATSSIDSREIADNTVRSKDLRNNSVYSGDLRNNDVRGIDIRNNTILGRDIGVDTITDDQVDESKLTQVPSAFDADRLGGVAASGYARAAQETVHVVGAAIGDALPPGFWKDTVGVVHLQGSVAGSEANFTLPSGYRPAGTAVFDDVTVTEDGVVTISGPTALDGITFRAD